MGTMREEVYGEVVVIGISSDNEFLEVWEDGRVEELLGDGGVGGSDEELL